MKRFILLLGVLGACVLGLKAEPKEIPVIQVTSVWNMEHLAKVKKQIQTPFMQLPIRHCFRKQTTG